MARRLLAAAYVVYLAAVAYLVWNPDPSAPGTAVLRLTDLIVRLGLPATASRTEFSLNVVMFVPLSLLGAFLFRRWQVSEWVSAGFLATVLIEVVQRLLLPTRTGSARDVVANTLGAFVGACAALVVRRLIVELQARRRPTRT